MYKREYMDFRDPDAQIERNYRDSHPFQWAREALQNSVEAGATRILFGVEWQAVKNRGVYRRTIIDNGSGLSYDEMPLFNTYGGGGKPIGGEHENFGIGFKSSVLPWNHEGVVVISLRDGEQHMMWLDRDPKNGRYGVRRFSLRGTLESIVPPFDDDEYGVDWRLVLPDWVHEAGHGTALVLLGNASQDDTILGAPDRDENQRTLAKYLNTRYFNLHGVDVSIVEFPTDKKASWPTDPDAKLDGRKAWQYRTVNGALHYIRRELKESSFLAEGVFALSTPEEAVLHWYLRQGTPLATNVSEQNAGFFAMLYRNELYNFSPHPSTMRRFGINATVGRNLFLLIEPREFERADPKRGGFYPNNTRTQLLRGGYSSGKEAPVDDWSDEFRANLPQAIVTAINATRPDDEKLDDDDLKRLRERFGARWRIPLYLIQSEGNERTRVIDDLIDGGRGGDRGKTGIGGDKVNRTLAGDKRQVGMLPEGDANAVKRLVSGGLPECYFRAGTEFEDQWMLAQYTDRSAANPTGLIELNQDHPVIVKHIDELVAQYAENEAETVAKVVRETYRRLAVSHVAHSEQFKSFPDLTRSVINERFRSPEALTMALLGLVAAEALAGPELGGRLGRKLKGERQKTAS